MVTFIFAGFDHLTKGAKKKNQGIVGSNYNSLIPPAILLRAF